MNDGENEYRIECELKERFQETLRELKKTARQLTDIGNAARFQLCGEEVVVFIPGIGWHHYDGTRWKHDPHSHEAMEIARRVIKNIILEAAESGDDSERRSMLLKHAESSSSLTRLNAMIKLAESQMAVQIEDFDNEPDMLNVNNGVLDLRTGHLDYHDELYYMRQLAPVDYDPNATAPTFIEFIGQTFSGDQSLIEYVQTLLGMCITGRVTEQVFPFFHGVGGNGKSTLLDTLLWMLGDYATICPPDLLIVKRNEDHPTGMADLAGRRMVIASESKKGGYLNEAIVKRFTGDARIKARRLYKDFMEFDRAFKVIFVTNILPSIQEDTEAIWRRIRVIPFTNIVPRDSYNRSLPEQLQAEAPGILNWLVEGARRWFDNDGLPDCPAVTKETDLYRSRCNPAGLFVSECFKMTGSPDDWVSNATIKERLTDWSNGSFRGPDFRTVTDQLRSMGAWDGKRGNEGRGLRGVVLLDDESGTKGTSE